MLEVVTKNPRAAQVLLETSIIESELAQVQAKAPEANPVEERQHMAAAI